MKLLFLLAASLLGIFALPNDAQTATGEWELVSICRGGNTKIVFDIRQSSRGEYSANVYYWEWDGVTKSGIRNSWNAESKNASVDWFILEPAYYYDDKVAMQHGRNLYRYDVTFRRGPNGWEGQIGDPDCINRAFVRPGPPVMISASGEAVSSNAWVDKKPTELIGRKDFFQYFNVPNWPSLAPAAEVGMIWSPLQTANLRTSAAILTVNLGAYVSAACNTGRPAECDLGGGARVFVFTPPNDVFFASKIADSKMQICDAGTQWKCIHVNEVPEKGLPPQAAAQWIWDARRRAEADWSRLHPAKGGACRQVKVWHRTEYSWETECDPVISGDPQPTYAPR